jgi:hypothetical protein
LVSGGGLGADGQWHASRGGYLLPVRALKAVYRGKLLSGLRRQLDRGELRLPPATSPESARRLLRKIARKDWNVRIQERYGHGRGVMRYLGRYVRGGPISNRRLIQATDAEVQFRYQDHRDGKGKVMTLTRDEFIARVLWHVPESGRHTTRHYGLYGHKARPQRALCRAQLGQAAEPERPAPVDWQSYLQRLGHGEKTRCPSCGAPMRTAAAVPRQRKAHRISIGSVARSGFVQQGDEVAIQRGTLVGHGPPGGGVFLWP